jgi:hypothetical protein
VEIRVSSSAGLLCLDIRNYICARFHDKECVFGEPYLKCFFQPVEDLHSRYRIQTDIVERAIEPDVAVQAFRYCATNLIEHNLCNRAGRLFTGVRADGHGYILPEFSESRCARRPRLVTHNASSVSARF